MKLEHLIHLVASTSVAGMAGCTLDSTGLLLDEQVADAGIDATNSDSMQPTLEAAPADGHVSDGGPDAQGTDAEPVDAFDGSEEGAFESGVDDVVDTEDGPEADAPDPPDAPAPVVDSMIVASDSLAVDRVRAGDGPVAADGEKDGAFIVSLYGEVAGLAMISTDAAGAPFGAQQWDTYVAAATIPSGVGTGFTVGYSTWQLGVWEGQTALNASDGSLLPIPPGAHTLQLYAANSGWFVAGRHFRVAVELAGGQVIWGPVLGY